MKIFKKGNKIIVEIDLWQDSFDAIGQKQSKIGNVVGIIAGEEQGLAKVIDLGYKGSFDYGEIFLKTYYEDKDFIKLCKKLGISFFEYPICAYCGKVIYGPFALGDKGNQCFDCEHKKNTRKSKKSAEEIMFETNLQK